MDDFIYLNNPYYLQTKSLTNLYDEIYSPKATLIENLLYSGTYLFVGAPKVGKSFMMAQLAYHISRGINLWDYAVTQGTVLYLALEDIEPRIQMRLSRMFGTEENDKLHFAVHSSSLNCGLEKRIEFFIMQHPDTKLIIIDTLQKIRELGSDKYSYANDYDIVAKLKQFSDFRNICMLLVHHTRKQQAEDCFETISGNNGLLGAADGAFVLQREKRIGSKATLDISGRDQQDQRLYLEFDKEHCLWKLIKAETELWKLPADPVLEKVAKFVSANPNWTGTAMELAEKIGSELSPNVLTRHLNVNAGRLSAEYDIAYDRKRTKTNRLIILNSKK